MSSWFATICVVPLALSGQALPERPSGPVVMTGITFAEGPDELIRKAIAAQHAQEAKGWKFVYREEEEWRDQEGRPMKPFVRTYDVIMLEGENYRKLILFDGQPIDAKTQKKVDAELAKAREERKKHKFLNKRIHLGNMEQLGLLFDSRVKGEEMIGGRKAWCVESEPKADMKGANAMQQELLATHRVTWIDEAENVEVRRETTYFRTVNKIQAGTHGEIEWGKVGEAWVPIKSYFRGEVKFLPGVRSFGNNRKRYYDYKLFTAESSFIPN